jgi:hypothetical protein
MKSDELLQEGKLAEALVQRVSEHDWVSFPEALRFLGQKMCVEGDHSITFTSDPNLIVWADVSQEFSDLVIQLIKDRKLYFHGSSALIYMIDGGMLNLPIVKRVSRKPYKNPHWLPVCLRTVPLDTKTSRSRRRG